MEQHSHLLVSRDLGAPALSMALQALAQHLPAATARAGAALDTILQGAYCSAWPEVAWRFSRLTGDGFPVEFAFVSQGASIRYTVEVAGPEAVEADRLDLALAAMDQLGAARPPAAITSILRQAQHVGSLRYGTWISGRHDESGDRFKLYVEVPRTAGEQAVELFRPLLMPNPLLPTRPSYLRMIGYEPDSARTELYFEANALEFWEATRLMKRFGLAEQTDSLFALIEQTGGLSLEHPLPGARAGFSLSLSGSGGPPLFSLFSTAWAIFGGDGQTRQQLLALAESRGWELAGYDAVSTTLSGRTGWKTWHSVVSFIAAPAGPPILSIGLRPPEPNVLA